MSDLDHKPPAGAGARDEVEILMTLDRSQSLAAATRAGASLDQNRQLSTLYRVSSLLNTTRPVKEVMPQVMELMLDATGAEHASLFLSEGETLVLKHEAVRPGISAFDRGFLRREAERSARMNSTIVCASGCYQDEKGEAREGTESLLCLPLWSESETLGVACLAGGRKEYTFSQDDIAMLASAANHVATAISRERMQERMREGMLVRANLERFHSPDVVSHLLTHSEGVDFHGFLQEREVTILFADIAEFTGLIERLKPREAAELIGRYFDLMTGIVFNYKGTVDKFIGDCVMAIFGAPISHGNDAELAAFAALDMMGATRTFKQGLEPRKQFDIRIGINTGVVLAGYMGSARRIEYTVLGDPVNVAARLQSAAEPGQILVGESAYSRVSSIFTFKERGPMTLKGKKRETEVWELLYR